MADTKTTAEATRSPIDGTELVRLATTGTNWKATLGDIFSTLARTTATAHVNLYVAILAGNIAGGSLYTNGYYTNVSLTGGSGTGAVADIYVSGAAVVDVIPSAGSGYVIGDVLSAPAASIGGTGSGFTFTLTGVGSNTNNGTSTSTPFLTPQHCYDTMAQRYDFANFNAIMNLAHGRYAPFGNGLVSINLTNIGFFVVLGDNSSPGFAATVPFASVVFTGTIFLGGTLPWISGCAFGNPAGGGSAFDCDVTSTQSITMGEPTFTQPSKSIWNGFMLGPLFDESLDVSTIIGANITSSSAYGMFVTFNDNLITSVIGGGDFKISGAMTVAQFCNLKGQIAGYQIIGAFGFINGGSVTGNQAILGRGTKFIGDSANPLPGTANTITFVSDAGINYFSGTLQTIYPGQESVSSLAAGESRRSVTSNLSLVFSNHLGVQFDNTGAGGEVDFTLPAVTASDVGAKYGFCVIAAQTLKVIAPASTKIAIGATNSAAAGNIASNTPFSYVEIEAVSTTQWAAKYSTGTWVVT